MSVGVAVEALTLTLGSFQLKNIGFAAGRGEILVILGPNGSGKSVMLETIAGFHRPDTGRILIGGRDVTQKPPEQRQVGFVIQNFGLFPHLTVAQNVAIARRPDRAGAAPASALPTRGDPAGLLSYFGVAHLSERVPAALSPGEKQRVALARALAGVPDLFLFDEPFSALDAQTQDELREDLKSFLRTLAIPAIFVTHDRGDAMILADKIVVLRDGALIQGGPADEIFQRPANSFVARFIGIENIIPARALTTANGIVTLAIGEQTLRSAAPAIIREPSSPVVLCIRAEDVTINTAPGERSAGANRLHGHITGLRTIGPLTTVETDCGFPLKAHLLAPQARQMKLGIGRTIEVEIAADAIQVMTE